MRRSALLACLLLLLATLFWWAFAFAPLPSAAPGWVAVARDACFGRAPNGLPEPYGWMSLILSPLMLLTAIFIVWSPEELRVTWQNLWRQSWGKALVAAALVLTAGEAVWVMQRLKVALSMEQVRFDASETEDRIPDLYPKVNQPMPAFQLVDQHGQTITEKTFLGRPVVLTFAFAHCATVCPVLVRQVLDGLAPEQQVEVLIVTLDPWRDTPSALPGLAKKWRLPSFAHVLSSARVENVTSLFPKFNMPSQRDEKTGDISHPALVFIIDSQGQWIYTLNNPPSKWILDAINRVSLRHAGI